jgi:glutaredoxin
MRRSDAPLEVTLFGKQGHRYGTIEARDGREADREYWKTHGRPQQASDITVPKVFINEKDVARCYQEADDERGAYCHVGWREGMVRRSGLDAPG